MKSILVKAIRSTLSAIGLEINRAQDRLKLDAYHDYHSDELQNKPFYNIGAGSFFHPYWTNIDYVSNWYKGIQKNVIHHDLMSCEPLPIETNQAKIIYTSHTIEHISDDAVRVLFAEAYRVLENGGVFRITTGPDAETDYRALINGDEDWFYWDRWYSKKGSYEHIFSSPAHSVPLSERWLHHVASQLAKNDISPSEHKLSDSEIWSAIDKYGFPDVLDYFCGLCKFQSDRPGNHISW